MTNIVTDFGADPTGVSDSTTSIQNAVNSGNSSIFFPDGTYLITSTIQLNVSRQKIFCEGRCAAIVQMQGTGPAFKIGASVEYTEIHNLQIDRQGTPVSGDDGVLVDHGANLIRLDNLRVLNHYVGLNLGYTGYSYVENCYIHENYSHGVLMQAINRAGGFQWTVSNTLSQTNNGCGFAVLGATSGANTLSTGEFNNISTYANGQGGLRIAGNQFTSFATVRIMGGFLGQDGGTEVHIDTRFTLPVKIVGTYVESAGQAPCGRKNLIPPTNIGYGFFIAANNGHAILDGLTAAGNSYSGIYTEAGKATITGCQCLLNGAAGVNGLQQGIYVAGGRAIVTGNNCDSNGLGMTIGTDNHIICDNSLSNNTITSYSAVPLSVTKFANNLL